MSYDQVLQLVLRKGFPAEGAPIMAATIMAESGGNPSAANLNPSDPGGSYGLTQINAGAHGPKAKEALGNPDRAVELAYDISKGGTDFSPWTAYKTGAYKRFLPQGGAAPAAAAPAGGGGLLNLPQVPNAARDYFGAAAPASPTENGGPFAGFIGGSAVGPKAPLAAGIPRGPAGDIGPAGPQGEVVVPMPPRPAPPPLAIPDLPPQVAAALAQAAPGLLMPGGGLLPRGGGAPGMPPAVAPADAMPSDDPRLQLGPLAPTPAPAAAAPAAPGPGLLAAPGMPTAPALPRVNPAYDAYLRNLGIAGALSKGAGLPDVLGPLTEALTKSPSYQAALETARKAAGLPFIGPETTAKKAAEEPFDIRASERALGNSLTEKGWRLDANGQAVRIPGYDQMTEATALATARGTAEGGLPTTLIIKSVENQNKIIADAAANGNQVTFDKDGKMSVSRLPGADTAAQAAAEAQTRGTQSQATTEVTVRGADGRDYKKLIPQTDLARTLREQPPVIPGQPVPPGTIVGTRQAAPLDTLGVEALKDAGTAAKTAYGRMQEYGQLAQAAQNFTTGPTTEKWFEVKRYLKDAGIISGTELPDQEIFQLAQKRLGIAAAPKGQGATSDFERSLYASALPSMATSPEGLARAIAIANRLDQYDVKVAQIHEDVARSNNGYPDYLEVQRRLRELGPPLSDQEKAALTALQPAASGAAPAAPAAAPAGSIRTPYGTITPRQ
jgi:hypothetical protein